MIKERRNNETTLKHLFVIIIISLILLTGCSYQKDGGVVSGNLSFYLKTSDKKVIAGLLDPRVTIYATGEKDGFYEGLVIELGDTPLQVSWESVSDPDYAPQLFIADLNKDGKNELVIILTEQCAEGNIKQHLRIMEIDSQHEVDVLQPMEILDNYTDDSAITQDAIIQSSNIGNSIEFTIENNKLKGIVSITDTRSSMKVGEIVITYKHTDAGYSYEHIQTTTNY